MGTPIDQDLKPVLVATRVALEANHLDELRHEVLAYLEKVFVSEKCTFFLADKSGKDIDCKGVITRGFDRSDMEVYETYYHNINPYSENLFLYPSAVLGEQVIAPEELETTEFFNDYLKLLNIQHHMIITLKSEKHLLGVLSFLRSASLEPFSAGDRFKAELIADNLLEVLKKQIILNQTTRRVEILECVASALPQRGIILLDDSLVPIYVDNDARSMLESLGPGDNSDIGPLGVPEELLRYCHEKAKSTEFAATSEKYNRLDIASGGPSSLRRILFRRVDKYDGQSLYVVCLEPSSAQISSEKELAKAGLSKRESEITRLLWQGLPNKEVSDRLCISKFTVDNHVKSIYRKLRVTNRTSLLHRLMELGLGL